MINRIGIVEADNLGTVDVVDKMDDKTDIISKSSNIYDQWR